MKLGFASDHRGYNLKQKLIEYFNSKYEIIDYGTNNTESCDYPIFAVKLGKGILNNEVTFGIAICGSGIGINIALNKIKGIYCAKLSNQDEAIHTREDNNTNCLSFGENMDYEEAIKIIETFINTPYSKLEKHQRRIKEVKDIEEGTYNA